MSLCYQTELDTIDRESFYICDQSWRKTDKVETSGNAQAWISPSKIVINHITFDEQIQEQYLSDVW